MENRFKHFIEAFIFVIFFLAIYWILGFIIKKIFNKEIRSTTGYTVIIVLAFVFRRFLISSIA